MMIPYTQYDLGGVGGPHVHPGAHVGHQAATGYHHHHSHLGHVGPHDHMHQQELPKYSRLLFKLPRVVQDQREKFENDDLFKKHQREGEVRYTLHRDRPVHERQAKFQAGCRDGHTEISFSGTGLVILLNWTSFAPPHPMDQKYGISQNYCDFNREQGKVHISSSFILNGVCVRWRGWLDLERLDGAGSLELDEALMHREEANLAKHLALVQQRLKDCEERYRNVTGNTTAVDTSAVSSVDQLQQMKKLPGYI